ncbi:MAG TPA: hypothetical protein ENJ80_13405 [Gammaproteobacteria bacterium]|nr:hypothetical protein [Gammaproteobacteria bacterium]
MTTLPRWILFPLATACAFPASAILLDCKTQGDGTYLCVEIEASDAITAVPGRVPEIDTAHIEQARSECTYNKPRRRLSGMGASGAVRSEARKAAQKEYDQCVADKAWELRNREAQKNHAEN